MIPMFLLTDVLIWLLVMLVVWAARRAWVNPLVKASWGLVFRSKIASASFVVLMLMITVALLDSIHLRLDVERQSRYGSPVISVLDVLVGPMAYQREKSYSRPLSIVGLNKENIQRDDGVVRDYPRLKFAGAHLAHPNDLTADVMASAYRGAVYGGLLWAVLVWLCWVIRRFWAKDQADQIGALSGSGAFHSAIWTLGLGLVVMGVCLTLGQTYHVMGTDKVGVDVFYSALKSMRTAVLIGLLTTLLTLPLGVLMGLAAGYFQGWVDDVIQYIYTTLNSIPSVLLIAASVLVLQVALEANPELFASTTEKADVRLFFLCMILGLTSWTGLARLLRGEVLKMREQDYVLAAKACGVSHWRMLVAHLLPNLMHLVLITLVMDFSGLVLSEAMLSYVGVGVDPSTFSYGTLINSARLELSREPMVWWPLVAAFVFMLLLVLAANLFADEVQGAFDPKARHLKQTLVRV